jgi:energy-coupling factor transport system permease protein
MGPLQRVSIYGQMAVPLVLGALLKSQQMEIALQSRAYSGRRDRTYLHESSLTTSDILVIFLLISGFIGSLVTYYRFGIGSFAWIIFD